jgi:serine/threonine protein kinase
MRESRRSGGAPGRIHKLIGGSPHWCNGEIQLYRLASQVAPDTVPPYIGAFDANSYKVHAAYMYAFEEARAVLVMANGDSIDWQRQCADEPLTMCHIEQLLEALVELHAIGIVHNDIKPQNFVEYGGRLRLIDFGHAQLAVSKDGRAPSTHPLGTEGYTPPEMYDEWLRADVDADAADSRRNYHPHPSADIFAVGRTLDALELPADVAMRRAFVEWRDRLMAEHWHQRPTAAQALADWRELAKVCCWLKRECFVVRFTFVVFQKLAGVEEIVVKEKAAVVVDASAVVVDAEEKAVSAVVVDAKKENSMVLPLADRTNKVN